MHRVRFIGDAFLSADHHSGFQGDALGRPGGERSAAAAVRPDIVDDAREACRELPLMSDIWHFAITSTGREDEIRRLLWYGKH